MFWVYLVLVFGAVLFLGVILQSFSTLAEAGDIVLEEREGMSLVHDHSDEVE